MWTKQLLTRRRRSHSPLLLCAGHVAKKNNLERGKGKCKKEPHATLRGCRRCRRRRCGSGRITIATVVVVVVVMVVVVVVVVVVMVTA